VLEQEGEIAGCGGLHSSRADAVLTLGMMVRPGRRGRGGGRLLLERLIGDARAGGAHKLALEVWPDNGRAMALYASAGFEIEGVLHDHYRRRDGSLRSAVLTAMPLQGA